MPGCGVGRRLYVPYTTMVWLRQVRQLEPGVGNLGPYSDSRGEMKVFRVVAEQDGKTTKAPVRTEIIREESRYAAETIQEVWEKISWMLNRPDEFTIIAIIEEAPAITVLSRKKIANDPTL